jgi:hypothetical protein
MAQMKKKMYSGVSLSLFHHSKQSETSQTGTLVDGFCKVAINNVTSHCCMERLIENNIEWPFLGNAS